MTIVRMIFLLLVPLLVAAPSLARQEVGRDQPRSALLRVGARPAHEARESADDVWRADGSEPGRSLAWESLFSVPGSLMLSAGEVPTWPGFRGARGECEPPAESGVGDSLCGRAPPAK